MIVYGATMSPFVRKLMAYGAEKGLALELRNAGMGRGGPDFDEASPFGLMPGFRDPGADDGRDFVLSDSTAIIAYLEAKHPEPNLIPSDPIGRGRAIWYEEFADTIAMKASGGLFWNRVVAPKFLQQPGDAAVAATAEQEHLPRALDYLEKVVPASGFLLQDRITLADLAVASPFVNVRHAGVDLDGTRWPRAVAYLDGILARPSFAGMITREQAALARLG